MEGGGGGGWQEETAFSSIILKTRTEIFYNPELEI